MLRDAQYATGGMPVAGLGAEAGRDGEVIPCYVGGSQNVLNQVSSLLNV
jgi:hypothetical protein